MPLHPGVSDLSVIFMRAGVKPRNIASMTGVERGEMNLVPLARGTEWTFRGSHHADVTRTMYFLCLKLC